MLPSSLTSMSKLTFYIDIGIRYGRRQKTLKRNAFIIIPQQKLGIACVPSRTFLVFQAGHFVCSKQDISCAPSKTFRVFQAGHFLCFKQHNSCVPRRTFHVFQAGHFLRSNQDTPCGQARKNVLAQNVLIIPLTSFI